MVIGIHPDRTGTESYSEKWRIYLNAYGIESRVLNLLARDSLEQAQSCHGVMWRWTHNPNDKQSAQRIMYIIESQLGIPVFPDFRSTWHYDEKIAQFYLLRSLSVPMPKTWLFWEYEEALSWSGKASYPVVFKLSTGAGSTNVLRIDSHGEAVRLIEQAFKHGIFPYRGERRQGAVNWRQTGQQFKALLARGKNAWSFILSDRYPPLPAVWWKPERDYAYFQEFLPGNAFDIRITVIGNRAFGFRRFNRPGDFRASGSGQIDYDPSAIDLRCVEIAFQVSRQGRFQSMAYDFLYDHGEPVISEISYTFADRAIYDCPGHWQIDMNWISGQMWPEEAQVKDFVYRIRTEQQLTD